MLTRIHIRDLVIVKALELEFGAGMSVLTGETGAGKSILIDALGLALGAKAQSSMIRQGAARAEVTASFDLGQVPAAHEWLATHDLGGDGECLLRRVLVREGRSRAYINGSPVPQAKLGELGALLVDIHGQHAHQSLLRPRAQAELLDAYGGHLDKTRAVALAYRALRDARSRLQSLEAAAGDRAARLDYLAFQLEELEAIEDDLERLDDFDAEHRRLANAEEILTGAGTVAAALDEDDGLGDRLRELVSSLEGLASVDDALGGPAELLESARIQAEEAADALRRYLDGVELDPERLHEIDRALGRIHDLARKHRTDAHELGALLATLRDEQATLRDSDSSLQALETQVAALQEDYRTAAEALSQARHAAAATLGATVTESMALLGMQDGQFRVDIQTDAGRCQVTGSDGIEFLVAANPGQPAGPLAKVASGGELSRISLAIQVATANCGQVPSLIFDEVDVGIGGGTAEVVGRLLRELGNARQVLCVTHLAQVAAQAHGHLRVSKISDGTTTETRIDELGERQRIDELARMMGGVEITEQTLAHAREMLERGLAG